MALDSMVCAGVVVSGGVVRAVGALAGRAACTRAPRSRARCSCTASTSATTRSCATRSSTRTYGSRPGPQIGVDPEADRERFHISAGRDRRDRQGRDGGCLTSRVALLTREYPPEVYGGAGVHVEYLARELARLVEVTVHAWGADRPPRGPGEPPVVSYRPWDALAGSEPYAAALQALSIDLAMAAGVEGANLVHSHTWYANLAGHLAQLVHGDPARRDRAQPRADAAVEGRAARRRLRALELLRADRARGRRRDHRRLGRDARATSCACYPAIDPGRVSVIHNGIDTDEYRPDPGTACSSATGSTPSGRRSCSSAGSRARRASRTCSTRPRSSTRAPSSCSCAGAPDTPELAAETAARRRAAARRPRRGRLDRRDAARGDVIQILSHASVFVCPSVYEPLGIVNLEAMACEAPVVATRTGGSPRWSRTASRACSSPSSRRTTARGSRSTRPASRTGSPSGSTSCSPTRSGPPRSAGPAAPARWSSSAGRRRRANGRALPPAARLAPRRSSQSCPPARLCRGERAHPQRSSREGRVSSPQAPGSGRQPPQPRASSPVSAPGSSRQRQLPAVVPGVFIRASLPSPSTSWAWTIASVALVAEARSISDQCGSAGSRPVAAWRAGRGAPPAERRVQVVRPGVDDDAARVMFSGVRVGGPAAEAELEHRHARQPELVAQTRDGRSDDPEVLEDQGQRPELGLGRAEDRRAGAALPEPARWRSAPSRAPPSRRRSRGNGRPAPGRRARSCGGTAPTHQRYRAAAAPASHRGGCPRAGPWAERVGRRAATRPRGRARDGRCGRRRRARRRSAGRRSAVRRAPRRTGGVRPIRARSAPGAPATARPPANRAQSPTQYGAGAAKSLQSPRPTGASGSASSPLQAAKADGDMYGGRSRPAGRAAGSATTTGLPRPASRRTRTPTARAVHRGARSGGGAPRC